MNRIGALIRNLYAEELKPAAGRTFETGEARQGGKKKKLKTFKTALSERRTIRWIKRIVAVLVVLFVIAESIFQWNRLSAAETAVVARRAGIGRELQRRENLIPNLVYAVSKYAAYEQGVFKYVSDAREALKMIRSSQTPRAQVSSILEKSLSGLVALAEKYPDLKATQSIQDLIKEAANTEDRIAEAKKEYNAANETYNQYRSVFPGTVYKFIYRFKDYPYVGQEEDMKVPVINLNMTGQEQGQGKGQGQGQDVKADPIVTKPGEEGQENPVVPQEVSDPTSNNTIEK